MNSGIKHVGLRRHHKRWLPSKIDGLFSWYMSSGLVGSPADSWTDEVDGGSLAATGTNRPSVTAPGGVWTQQVATFDGTDDRMVSALGASSYKFLHDGTGCGVGVLFNATATSAGGKFLLATDAGSSANIGFEVWYYGAASPATLYVACYRGVGGAATFAVSNAGLVTLNAVHSVFVRHKTGETNEFEVYFDGVLVNNGLYSNAPSSSNPTGTLRVGSATSGIYPYTGDVADIVLCNTYTSTADIDSLIDFWASEYT